MRISKPQRAVAQAIIDGIDREPWVKLNLSQDKFNEILDQESVREFIRADRERQIFLAGQEACTLLRQVLAGPMPGKVKRSLNSTEQKFVEYALRLNGLTGKSPIQSKHSTGVSEFIDPEAVAN